MYIFIILKKGQLINSSFEWNLKSILKKSSIYLCVSWSTKCFKRWRVEATSKWTRAMLTGSFNQRYPTTKRPPFAVRCAPRASISRSNGGNRFFGPERRRRSFLWRTGACRVRANSMASALGILNPRLLRRLPQFFLLRNDFAGFSFKDRRTKSRYVCLSFLPSLSPPLFRPRVTKGSSSGFKVSISIPLKIESFDLAWFWSAVSA